MISSEFSFNHQSTHLRYDTDLSNTMTEAHLGERLRQDEQRPQIRLGRQGRELGRGREPNAQRLKTRMLIGASLRPRRPLATGFASLPTAAFRSILLCGRIPFSLGLDVSSVLTDLAPPLPAWRASRLYRPPTRPIPGFKNTRRQRARRSFHHRRFVPPLPTHAPHSWLITSKARGHAAPSTAV